MAWPGFFDSCIEVKTPLCSSVAAASLSAFEFLRGCNTSTSSLRCSLDRKRLMFYMRSEAVICIRVVHHLRLLPYFYSHYSHSRDCDDYNDDW